MSPSSSTSELFGGTYARGEALSPDQRAALAAEEVFDPAVTGSALAHAFAEAVERALAQLRATDPATVFEPRGVGRAGLPSTVLGLLGHDGLASLDRERDHRGHLDRA